MTDIEPGEHPGIEGFPPLDEFPDYDKIDSRSVNIPADSYEGNDEATEEE